VSSVDQENLNIDSVSNIGDDFDDDNGNSTNNDDTNINTTNDDDNNSLSSLSIKSLQNKTKQSNVQQQQQLSSSPKQQSNNNSISDLATTVAIISNRLTNINTNSPNINRTPSTPITVNNNNNNRTSTTSDIVSTTPINSTSSRHSSILSNNEIINFADSLKRRSVATNSTIQRPPAGFATIKTTKAILSEEQSQREQQDVIEFQHLKRQHAKLLKEVRNIKENHSI
jgi:preprotein translocase subunit SecD